MPDIFDEIGLEQDPLTTEDLPTFGGRTTTPAPEASQLESTGDIFDEIETAGDVFDELTPEKVVAPETPSSDIVGFSPFGEAFAELQEIKPAPKGEDPWPVVLGKSVLQATQVMPKLISEGGHIIRKSLDMPESDFRKSVKETDRILTLKTKGNKAKEYVGGAVRTLGEMVGTGFNLPLLVSKAGTEKTTEALDEGRNMGVSLLAGIGQGITEYATEKIPFAIVMGKGIKIGGKLLEPSKKFLGRLAQGAITDVPGELLATYTEMKLINEKLLDKTYTDDELKQALIDTAAVAGLTTFFATGATQGFIPEGKPAEPTPEPTPEAPIPPVEPTLEEVEGIAPEAPVEEAIAEPDIFDEISPGEAPTLEELTAEVIEEEIKLQPSEEDAIFNIEETERRSEHGYYYHDTIPESATEAAKESNIEAAKGVARESLRAVPEIDAVEYSGIKNPDRKREAATPIREAEAESLRAWAVQNNQVVPEFNQEYQEAKAQGIEGGQENYVYRDADSGRWFKANRLTHTPTYSELFDRTMLHNELFPDVAYEFEGFSEVEGEFLPIFSQPHVQETKIIDPKEKERLAAETLKEMGFKEESDFPGMIPLTKFVHPSGVVVSDINARNVAYVDGEIAFIDPIIEMDPSTKKNRLLNIAQKLLREEKGEIVLRQAKRAPRPEGRAGKVYDDIMEARETSLQKKKRTIKQTYKKLKTSLVDVAGNTKAALNKLGPEGKKAVMRHVAHGGAHSKALRMSNQATEEIYGGLTEEEHDYIDQYIYARRHLEISSFRPDFKLPGGKTPQDMQALIDSIPPEVLPEIERRAEVYWQTMDNQLQQLFDEGLLSEAQLKALRRVGRYYSPRVVLDFVDPMTTGFEGGKKITVPDSGIQRLTDEGTEKLVEGDTSLLLSQVINRTQSRIFKNRANQALYELAEVQPDNPIIRKAKVIKTTKEGKPVYQPAPRGWEKVSVMIEGQKREMLMPTEFAGEWIFKDPILLHTQRNMIQWLTGTKILKSMATGLNPEFAFTNVPRDIALIWMSTEEYSPVLPKAMGQIGLDISSVIKDAVTRKGAFENYINEGGGMEFLTHQGRFTSRMTGHIGQIQKVMGYFGETSEIMTRLALRQRAIKNGATPEEATIIARNYLDFTQGGNLAKAADSALPYLNAGIQATRGMIRAASTNPKLFSVKVAQVASIATMLYLANRLLNEEAWDEISDRDKVNNWIITTPYSYLDDTGTKRHIYFKIAKDQGQRVFSSIFENLAAKSIGDEANVEQVTLAVRDFIPFSPTNLPPTVEAMLGYSANKDFWFNEDIWKGPEVKPEEEFTRYTPQAFVELGRATGLSPERSKAALEQLFTYGNIWTSLVGGGTEILLKGLDEKDKDLVTEEVILKKPFVRKIVRSTDPFYKYGKEIKEKGIEERTEKFKTNRELDVIVQDHLDGLIERQEVVDFIKRQSPVDRKRLVSRFKSHVRLKDIPDRRFWIELMQEPPKTRAYIYDSRFKMSDTEKRKELEEISFRIPKFRGKTFNFHLMRLRKGK